MTLDIASLGGLLLLTAMAAYMQTLTGFAFGLIMMGGIGLTEVIPLPEAAVLVSVLVIINALQVLRHGWRDIAMREFIPIILSSLAFLLVGYWLLGVLMAASLDWLKLVLGAVIVLSSLQLLLKPAPLEHRSGTGSFVFFGSVAGLMGGLFSTAGPPLVYHLYRQPLKPTAVRETLVAVFAMNAAIRLATVAAAGKMPSPNFWWSLTTIPVVIAFTFLAKRWPPPISPDTMRRLAFLLLFLSGVSLGAPALLTLFGDMS